MTKQVINIGSGQNEGDGGPIRVAFKKINDNFTELYTSSITQTDLDNAIVDIVAGNVDLTPYALVDSLATVATSGDYDDLINPPTIPTSFSSLVNGIHTVSLGEDGNLTLEEFARIKGTNDLYLESYSDSGPTRTGLFLNGNSILGNAILFATNNVVISSNNDRTPNDWNFDTSGTITTPLLLPKTFTAVLDSAHKTGDPLTLTDTPWEFTVQFQVNPDGTVETVLNSIFPNLVNPGYTTADQFSFTEADHGIPGYTFELELDNLELAGPAGWTASPVVSIPPEYPATIKSLGAVKLTANDQSLVFGTDGSLTFPNNVTVDTNSGNFSVIADNYITLETLGPAQIEIGRYSPSGSLVIVGSTNTQFHVDSTLIRYAGDIIQSAQDNTQCLPNVDTVVYTSTGIDQKAIKLFVMAEGLTDGGGVSWDTQACDVIAVKGFNNNIVHVTTYGVTYSGATAIAEFDGRWNATTNRIEITCRPTSVTNDVRVSVHAIEMTTND